MVRIEVPVQSRRWLRKKTVMKSDIERAKKQHSRAVFAETWARYYIHILVYRERSDVYCSADLFTFIQNEKPRCLRNWTYNARCAFVLREPHINALGDESTSARRRAVRCSKGHQDGSWVPTMEYTHGFCFVDIVICLPKCVSIARWCCGVWVYERSDACETYWRA